MTINQKNWENAPHSPLKITWRKLLYLEQGKIRPIKLTGASPNDDDDDDDDDDDEYDYDYDDFG